MKYNLIGDVMEFFRNTLFDKGIYQINMLPARSHFSLADEENFNEDWYGKWYEDYDPEMLTWAKGEMSVDELDAVQVNLAPQLQGYGKLQYANTQYQLDMKRDALYKETSKHLT